ncbi:transglycosylase SLT domain-containing protein [Saccharomonospora xinjiangensis]|uniref:Transglycosylase family protein n=1 Tax=Saccharomonospora xinjiangensis XJ-54 TaxID=882086 RepID=I0V2X2_9PSEU|nr:transglycosylase SLT domain-containing protein [Saccharomonospora xinjiangensis]EID54475.1 transglycosylase family protein [Saccharomonospora xinjiangensis XJ-54]
MTGAGIPPEWDEVETKATRVDKVKPAEIQDVARQFDEASRDASDHTAELTNAAAPLRDGGVWSGPAADAFFDYVHKIAEAGSKVKDKLDEVAAELTALQETLSTIKRQIESVKDDAKKAIDDRNQQAQQQADAATAAMRDYENGDRDSPPSPTAEEIISKAGQENSRTATDAAKRIDDLLRQSNDAIRRAQELMKTEVGDGFSSVPEPGSAQSQQTATSGITGGGGAGGGGAGAGGGGGAGGGAAGGGGLAGYGPSGPPPSSGPPPGNVEQWIREAIKILQANGIPVTEENIDEIWTIIEKESGGNPHALNDWDSNAAKGTPSKGLMQCIDPTFNSYKLPGHDDIWNPVDNIIAGVRYTFDRYGGFEGHPGLKSMAQGGGYQGY